MLSTSMLNLISRRRTLMIAAWLLLTALPCTAQIRDQKNDLSATVRTIGVVNSVGVTTHQVTVPIELDSLGDEAAISFSVSFDPTKLSISGISSPGVNPDVTLGTGVAPDTSLIVNGTQAASGRIGILVDSSRPFSAGTGRQVVRLRFLILRDSNTQIPITFGDTPTSRSTANANGDLLPTAFRNGGVGTIFNEPLLPTITGRVTTPGGTGIRNAVVTLIDIGGPRTTTTSTFGYYTFDHVLNGTNTTVSVTARRYRFTPVTVVFTGDLTTVDFVGQQ